MSQYLIMKTFYFLFTVTSPSPAKHQPSFAPVSPPRYRRRWRRQQLLLHNRLSNVISPLLDLVPFAVVAVAELGVLSHAARSHGPEEPVEIALLDRPTEEGVVTQVRRGHVALNLG